MGEQFDENSPLIREPIRRDDRLKATHPRTVTTRSLQQAIYQTAVNAGIRKPAKLTESAIRGSVRHEVKITHGLKKFFVTQLTNAKIDPARREYLASHKHGRTNMGTTEMMLVYDRPEQGDLLKDYASAINLLTIDPAARQEVKIKELESKEQILNQTLEKQNTEYNQRLSRLEKAFLTNYQKDPDKYIFQEQDLLDAFYPQTKEYLKALEDAEIYLGCQRQQSRNTNSDF